MYVCMFAIILMNLLSYNFKDTNKQELANGKLTLVLPKLDVSPT